MSIGTYSRGRPVYGQGSYAPTRGHVSSEGALGYLKREIKKPNPPKTPFGGVSQTGADGQSDTRSGVASRLIANRPPGGGPVKPPETDSPIREHTPKPPTSPPVGTPGSGGPAPAVPTVNINENGILELPYSSEWSQQVLMAMQNMNTQLLDLGFDQQNQALQFAKANREADIDYGDVKRSTLGGNAAAGTAFSSQYGVAVGENARDFGNYKSDLAAANGLFNQHAITQRTAIQNAFNEMLRQDILNRAQQAESDPNATPPPNPGGGPGGPGGGQGNNNGPQQPNYNNNYNGNVNPTWANPFMDYLESLENDDDKKKKKKKKKKDPKNPKDPKVAASAYLKARG